MCKHMKDKKVFGRNQHRFTKDKPWLTNLPIIYDGWLWSQWEYMLFTLISASFSMLSPILFL